MAAQLIFAALCSGALYALVALGLNLVYGTLRLLNIAHGDLAMVGAYVAFVAMSALNVPPPVSMVLAAGLCALMGWVLYAGIFKRLLASPETAQRLEANSLILFYGVSVILQNVVALGFSATSKGYQYLGEVHRIGPVAASGNRLPLLAVALAVSLGILLLLRLHAFGWSLRAVIERREAAGIVGVNVDRVQGITIMLGFAIAGVAGVLVSMTEQITPFMGFPLTIAAFVVIVLGGLGNVFAGVLAGFVLGFVETFGIALTSATYRSILIYGLFVAVLLVRPQGLFGKAIQVR